MMTEQTTDDFDYRILLGKTIDSISKFTDKDSPDHIRVIFDDDSCIEFFLNKYPDILYMEPDFTKTVDDDI